MSTPTSLPAAPSLPQPRLRTAFGGVWRLTLPRYLTPQHALPVLGIIAALGLLTWLQASHDRAGLPNWISHTYLSFFVPLFAFVSAAGTLRDELKPSSTDYVLVRAIPRPAFVLFKFIAHLVATEIEFALAWAVVAGIGAAMHVSALVAALPTLLLAQSLVVIGCSGFGFLCAALTSRYIIVGLIYGAIVEIGVGQIPTQLNRLSMTHQVRQLLLPYTDPAGTAGLTTAGEIATTTAVLLLISLVALAAATAVFSLRELSSAQDA